MVTILIIYMPDSDIHSQTLQKRTDCVDFHGTILMFASPSYAKIIQAVRALRRAKIRKRHIVMS